MSWPSAPRLPALQSLTRRPLLRVGRVRSKTQCPHSLSLDARSRIPSRTFQAVNLCIYLFRNAKAGRDVRCSSPTFHWTRFLTCTCQSVSTELCCFCSQGRKALDSRQLSCTKMVTGERLEDPKQWSRLGEDRDSAEGKTKFFSDRREQGRNIPRCHANPEGQQEARGVGASPPEKGSRLSSAHYTAWAHGPGGRSCQMGMNGNSQQVKRPREDFPCTRD